MIERSIFEASRTSSDAVRTRLRVRGIRPTRERTSLAQLLFSKGDRHVTAEQLWNDAGELDAGISLATVYKLSGLHRVVHLQS